MSQFPCPTCGAASGCNHMIAPGAATPVAIVCDLTTPPDPPFDYELVNLLCNPEDGTHVITVLAFDPSTGIFTTNYYNQDGSNYTGTTPSRCVDDYEYTAPFIFCSNGSTISRTDAYLNNEYVISIWQDSLGNVIPTPNASDIVAGKCEANDYEILLLCDSGNNNAKFIRVIHFNESSVPSEINDYTLELLPYMVIGDACVCPNDCCPMIDGFYADTNPDVQNSGNDNVNSITVNIDGNIYTYSNGFPKPFNTLTESDFVNALNSGIAQHGTQIVYTVESFSINNSSASFGYNFSGASNILIYVSGPVDNNTNGPDIVTFEYCEPEKGSSCNTPLYVEVCNLELPELLECSVSNEPDINFIQVPESIRTSRIWFGPPSQPPGYAPALTEDGPFIVEAQPGFEGTQGQGTAFAVDFSEYLEWLENQGCTVNSITFNIDYTSTGTTLPVLVEQYATGTPYSNLPQSGTITRTLSGFNLDAVILWSLGFRFNGTDDYVVEIQNLTWNADITGCVPQSGTTKSLPVTVVCQDEPIPVDIDTELKDVESILLCDVDIDGNETKFIRHFVYDLKTGAIETFYDTTVESVPYMVVGNVGKCCECKSWTECFYFNFENETIGFGLAAEGQGGGINGLYEYPPNNNQIESWNILSLSGPDYPNIIQGLRGSAFDATNSEYYIAGIEGGVEYISTFTYNGVGTMTFVVSQNLTNFPQSNGSDTRIEDMALNPSDGLIYMLVKEDNGGAQPPTEVFIVSVNPATGVCGTPIQLEDPEPSLPNFNFNSFEQPYWGLAFTESGRVIVRPRVQGVSANGNTTNNFIGEWDINGNYVKEIVVPTPDGTKAKLANGSGETFYVSSGFSNGTGTITHADIDGNIISQTPSGPISTFQILENIGGASSSGGVIRGTRNYTEVDGVVTFVDYDLDGNIIDTTNAEKVPCSDYVITIRTKEVCIDNNGVIEEVTAIITQNNFGIVDIQYEDYLFNTIEPENVVIVECNC